MSRFIYKTTNRTNGKFYIGAHTTSNTSDGYLGSGVALRRAVKKYGVGCFDREILEFVENENDLYLREQHHIKKHINNPLCYNLHSGGKGGWTYVANHGLNRGGRNGMKDPNTVAKMVSSRRRTHAQNPEKYAKVARKNLASATASIMGSERTHAHKQKLSYAVQRNWQHNRDVRRDALASHFEVTSPSGEVTVTNRLEDFCVSHDLPYTTLWKTSTLLRPCVRGRAKGWSCRKI